MGLLDRQPNRIPDAVEVLAESSLGGLQLAPGDLDLLAGLERLGAECGDLAADRVDGARLLAERLADLSPLALLDRNVAESQVL